MEKIARADMLGLLRSTISSTSDGSMPISDCRDDSLISDLVEYVTPESEGIHKTKSPFDEMILKAVAVLSSETKPVNWKTHVKPLMGEFDPTTHTLDESLSHFLSSRTSSSGDACIALIIAEECRKNKVKRKQP